MLVKKRMSSPVITIEPNLPIMDALELMKSKGIRQGGIGHAYPLETMVGTDLVVRNNTCKGRII